MALNRQSGVLFRHPAAVVHDGDQVLAAILDGHQNLLGSRVNRIFNELLDDGGRTLHHLSGGDLVDQRFVEDADIV